MNLSLKFDPDNRTDHYQTPYRFFVHVAAKGQIKYKQIYRKIKINNLGPLQGGGGLTEGVNIYAEGGSWIGQEGQ